MTRELDARSEASLKWVIDIGERAFSVILFASFVARLSPSLMLKPLNGLAVLSEGLVVFFMVVRRHTSDVTTRPFDWIVAFIGTTAPMLVGPSAHGLASPAVCAALMLTGLLLGIWGKLILRRSFGLAAANRGVVNSGPYSFVRHPIYAGYLLVYLGFFLLNPEGGLTVRFPDFSGGWVTFIAPNLAIYLTAVVAMVLRVLAEEKVLSQDPAYSAFMSRVRYRLAPGLF